MRQALHARDLEGKRIITFENPREFFRNCHTCDGCRGWETKCW